MSNVAPDPAVLAALRQSAKEERRRKTRQTFTIVGVALVLAVVFGIINAISAAS